MDVLVIRHAIAEPRPDEGGTQPDDRLRELTPKGRRRMKRASRGLSRITPSIDLLASSPLVRAMQTAEIVSKAYGDIQITTVSQLEPGADIDAAVGWFREVETSGTVAIVGHDPWLSKLVGHLVTGHDHAVITLDKGGACFLEIPAGVPPGEARIIWVAINRQLRWISRKK